jgi:signal peptidase I
MKTDKQNTAAISLSGKEILALIEPLLSEGVAATFRVHGSSMYPIIREGDIVTVTPRLDNIRLGDVVALKHPINGSLLLHRVIARDAVYFLISGDNTADPDGYMPMSAILGIVTQVQRNGRNICFGHGPERTLITFLARWRLVRSYNVWRGILGRIKRLIIRFR